MNSPFMLQTAAALAQRAAAGSDEERVDRLYRIALGRPPSRDELALATEFARSNAWPRLAQTLLMTNEFMFID